MILNTRSAAPWDSVSTDSVAETAVKWLTVGIKPAPPFVINNSDGVYTGVSIELWQQATEKLGVATISGSGTREHLEYHRMPLSGYETLEAAIKERAGEVDYVVYDKSIPAYKLNSMAWKGILTKYDLR